MNTELANEFNTSDALYNLQFFDVFDLEDIQHLQDLFSDATGVASIITYTNGTPITEPSNFYRLCNIIRDTEKRNTNCCKSDVLNTRPNLLGSVIQLCLSGGLWNVGANITVGGKHVANWLIGQVRNEGLNEQQMITYADTIGVNRTDFMDALDEVPIISVEQFQKISNMLFVFANQLSEKAYNNYQLKKEIAEREQTNKLLQESKERYRLIAENTSDGIIFIGVDNQIQYASPAYIKQIGFSESDILSSNIETVYSRIHPNDREALFSKVSEAIELKKNALTYSCRIKHKAGHYIWRENNARFQYDISGNYNGVYVICRDITERKQAENQLKLLSRAIEQSPVTIVITDKEGNIEYANPKFTEVTGFTFEEVKGKTPRILKSGKHPKEFYETLWNTILSGKDWYGDFHNVKKNGEPYLEHAVISPLVNSKGDISFFIAVKEDITEKKKMLEELIEAKEHAEESDKLKTAFLNNISHEIRTPFNGILGFLSLIQDEDLLEDEKHRYINIINQSADRLMNTINNIVEIAQIQARQTKLTITETNISRLANELFNRLKPAAEIKEVCFILNNRLPNNDCNINTDCTKLDAVLTNLIKNAIKFTKEGSIEFVILKNVDCLEFSIKDTGIGIPENKLQIIFERFTQAEGSRTKQFEGSGLGLSIAKAYAEMIGGKILVKSEEGKGSTFSFIIPYN